MKDPKAYYLFVQERIEILEGIIGPDAALAEKALEDVVTGLAIERLLETITDATKHFPEDVKKAYPEIPWSQVAGFRNVMAHDYLGINPGVLLKTLTDDLPRLKKVVKRIMSAHG